MLGLKININGDASQFRREVDKTKKDAASGGVGAGKAFADQFKAGMMRFLGAGALISALQKAAQQALQVQTGSIKMDLSPEAFQELTKAAELLGMSVEELQTVAPSVANEFEALMESIREGGGILDADAVQTLADTADTFERVWSQIQPGLGLFAKSVSWLLGKGQQVAEANIGAAMAIYGRAKKRATGNDDIERAGVELALEAAERDVHFGSSPISSARRERVKAVRAAITENQRLVAARNMSIADSFQNGVGNLGGIPFIGAAFSEMTKAMQKTSESTRATAEQIGRKL